MCYPYTYTDLRAYLARLQADPLRARHVRRQRLALTIAGNECEMLWVTDHASPAEAVNARPVVALSARVHPGESNASWVMQVTTRMHISAPLALPFAHHHYDTSHISSHTPPTLAPSTLIQGIIDFLTGRSAEADALRRHCLFLIVPMLNPDGVICGNYRCSLAAVDLNRRWARPSAKLHPTIHALKKLLLRLHVRQPVALYVDIHGHSRKQRVFMYGCEDQGPSARMGPGRIGAPSSLLPQVFPLLISRVCGTKAGEKDGGKSGDNFFSFGSCNYLIKKAKESTGRVVVHRELSLVTSYTLEASFCGCDERREKRSQMLIEGAPAAEETGSNGQNSNDGSGRATPQVGGPPSDDGATGAPAAAEAPAPSADGPNGLIRDAGGFHFSSGHLMQIGCRFCRALHVYFGLGAPPAEFGAPTTKEKMEELGGYPSPRLTASHSCQTTSRSLRHSRSYSVAMSTWGVTTMMMALTTALDQTQRRTPRSRLRPRRRRMAPTRRGPMATDLQRTARRPGAIVRAQTRQRFRPNRRSRWWRRHGGIGATRSRQGVQERRRCARRRSAPRLRPPRPPLSSAIGPICCLALRCLHRTAQCMRALPQDPTTRCRLHLSSSSRAFCRCSSRKRRRSGRYRRRRRRAICSCSSSSNSSSSSPCSCRWHSKHSSMPSLTPITSRQVLVATDDAAGLDAAAAAAARAARARPKRAQRVAGRPARASGQAEQMAAGGAYSGQSGAEGDDESGYDDDGDGLGRGGASFERGRGFSGKSLSLRSNQWAARSSQPGAGGPGQPRALVAPPGRAPGTDPNGRRGISTPGGTTSQPAGGATAPAGAPQQQLFSPAPRRHALAVASAGIPKPGVPGVPQPMLKRRPQLPSALGGVEGEDTGAPGTANLTHATPFAELIARRGGEGSGRSMTEGGSNGIGVESLGSVGARLSGSAGGPTGTLGGTSAEEHGLVAGLEMLVSHVRRPGGGGSAGADRGDAADGGLALDLVPAMHRIGFENSRSKSSPVAGRRALPPSATALPMHDDFAADASDRAAPVGGHGDGLSASEVDDAIYSFAASLRAARGARGVGGGIGAGGDGGDDELMCFNAGASAEGEIMRSSQTPPIGRDRGGMPPGGLSVPPQPGSYFQQQPGAPGMARQRWSARDGAVGAPSAGKDGMLMPAGGPSPAGGGGANAAQQLSGNGSWPPRTWHSYGGPARAEVC